MKSLEQKQVERRKALNAELMPLTLEKVQEAFDERLDAQEKAEWSVSKNQADVLKNDLLPIIENLEYPMQMSGVVTAYIDKIKAGLKKITFQDVKIIQRFLNDSRFKGYEGAKRIQNVLAAVEPFNLAVADIEIDVYIINEIMDAKEKEAENGVWHELTKAWAAENNIELPETPAKQVVEDSRESYDGAEVEEVKE
jgi:hypothetical protein